LNTQGGFLSRLAVGFGLVGAALFAFVGASMFGLTDFSGPETAFPAMAILLAPMMGLVGVIAALASRWREGGDGWRGPLEFNGAVVAVAALVLLLAVI
jgi:hypothetical protein